MDTAATKQREWHRAVMVIVRHLPAFWTFVFNAMQLLGSLCASSFVCPSHMCHIHLLRHLSPWQCLLALGGSVRPWWGTGVVLEMRRRGQKCWWGLCPPNVTASGVQCCFWPWEGAAQTQQGPRHQEEPFSSLTVFHTPHQGTVILRESPVVWLLQFWSRLEAQVKVR